MFLFNGLVKELKFKEKKVQGEIFSFKLKDILNEVIIGVGNFVFFDLIINKKNLVIVKFSLIIEE